MTQQHPNVLRYMRVIRAFNENDLDTVKETCSENIVYRIAGRSNFVSSLHILTNC